MKKEDCQGAEPRATKMMDQEIPFSIRDNIPTFWPAGDNDCHGYMTTVYNLPISTSPKKEFYTIHTP